ncbi:hypothetical protein CDIK_2791 [Cucumispora dikerogammari]|nr:hypothetical protein CDIK_2791 [Cucumispora dikerogammari]
MKLINTYKELLDNKDFDSIITEVLNSIESPVKKFKIHISHLSPATKMFEIREIFNKNGIKIKKAKHFKRRGFCYLEVSDIKDFIKCFSLKEAIKGKVIIIKKARK